MFGECFLNVMPDEEAYTRMQDVGTDIQLF